MNAIFSKALLTLGLSSVVMFSMAQTKTTSNPLLQPSTLTFGAPDFSKIKTSHYLPALRKGIEEQRKAIDAITGNKNKATFENTIVAYENSGRLLDHVESIFFCLTSADKTPEITAIQKEIMPELIATQRWILTAFSEYPQSDFMVRFPFIHLKNVSMAQRFR